MNVWTTIQQKQGFDDYFIYFLIYKNVTDLLKIYEIKLFNNIHYIKLELYFMYLNAYANIPIAIIPRTKPEW